jgi:hypothetical protein
MARCAQEMEPRMKIKPGKKYRTRSGCLARDDDAAIHWHRRGWDFTACGDSGPHIIGHTSSNQSEVTCPKCFQSIYRTKEYRENFLHEVGEREGSK